VAVRGRDRELRRLTGRHARGLIVLAGAGGMGKTTLATAATDAARRHGRRVHWVRFRDGEQLTGRMLEVAEQLGLSRAAIATAQQTGSSLPDLVWRHLDRTRGWVIVLDNADRPAATCPSGDPVAEYRGWVRPARRGVLLVTSRDRASWGPRATLVPVGPLSPEDGARVLLDLASSGGTDARRLATRLGGLPLALQAAALAVAAPTGRHRTFAAYADALEARTTSVLPDAPDVENPDVARSLVGHTWELSLDQLADEGLPLARPVLRTLALCADAPVPRLLIGPALLDPVVDGPVREAAVDGALAGLDRYGLVDVVDVDGVPAVVLHPVVRESSTALLAAVTDLKPWRRAVDAALTALADECIAAGRAGWSVARTVAPHLTLLAALDEPADGDREAFLAARETLATLTDLLSSAGAYRTAAMLGLRLVDAGTAHLGADHPYTLESRSRLAVALNELGQCAQAADLHRANLTDYERVLGPDHPDTLNSRSNLALALDDLGNHRQAADLFRITVATQERVIGPDHPDTLISRESLARAEAALRRRPWLRLRRPRPVDRVEQTPGG
jgi:hypothetical protein